MDNTASQAHTTGLRAPAHVRSLLAHLHTLSLDQENQLGLGNGGPSINKATDALRSGSAQPARNFDDTMRDKFIALTEDKALFVYNMIRAKGALTVVEAGTSFGVSTIYLALAVGQNASSAGKMQSEARVIATEREPTKAAKAREHWKMAGETVEQYIELREGDILQTLRSDVPEVDFILFDSMLPLTCGHMIFADRLYTVWTPMVLPTLKLLELSLKPGAVIIVDNVVSSKEGYSDFLAYINRTESPYSTVTLPYPGGLSMSTFRPMLVPEDLTERTSNLEIFAPPDKTGRAPEAKSHIRIARPTRDIGEAQRFYVDGLDMQVLYRVTAEGTAHDASGHVDDLIMLGWPDASWHLEFVLDHTEDAANACLPRPTVEDLLVVYVDGPIDRNVLQRLVNAGGREVRPKNPYWEQWGVTVEDPDGYRIVLSQRQWVNKEVRARWIASK